MAWRKLAALYTNGGQLDPAGERLAATNAYRFRDHLTPLERDLTEGTYFNSVTFQFDSAVAAYRAALEINPADPVATNNAAIILGQLGQHREEEQLLRQGMAAAPVAHKYSNLQISLAAAGEMGQRRLPGRPVAGCDTRFHPRRDACRQRQLALARNVAGVRLERRRSWRP